MTEWLPPPKATRRRFHVAAVGLAALLGAAGCGGGGSVRATPPPSSSAPTTLPLVAAESVTMTAAETGPIVIPEDPYAAEPVVEIGMIDIPKLGLRHRLFQGVTLHNIDRGPSHWPGSAMPGEPGNAVVAGHRATHSQPFRHIDDLVDGDTVAFTVSGVRSAYRVTGSRVVGPEETWIADQTEEATATLYACHPPGSERQRYVVHLALA